MRRMTALFLQVQNEVRLSMAEKRLNSEEIRQIPVFSAAEEVKHFNPTEMEKVEPVWPDCSSSSSVFYLL